jgi:hypothetical protein
MNQIVPASEPSLEDPDFITFLSKMEEHFLKKIAVEQRNYALAANRLRLMQSLVDTCRQLSELNNMDDILYTYELKKTDSIERIINVMNRVGKPQTLQDLVASIKEYDPDFFPVQIINHKAYLLRKVNIACNEGLLGTRTNTSDRTKYYFRPSENDG